MPSTSRRTVLRAVGVLTAALAGCQDQLEQTRTRTTSETITRTPTDTNTPTGTATESPSPTESETESSTPGRVDEACDDIWNPVDRWRHETGVRSYQPVVVDGTVYFGAQGDHLYALDATDGTVHWRQDQPVQLYGRTEVDGGTVVVASHSEVSAYEAASGGFRWTVAPPGEAGGVETDVAVDGGRAFYASDNRPGTMEETSVPRYHRLYAVDVEDGESLWTVELSTDAGSEGIAATDGTVYLTTGDGRLLAFDTASGDRIWEYTFVYGGRRGYRPIVGQDAVYVQTGGHLAAVDAEDGSLRWRRDGSFHDDPVVGGTAVYCATKRNLVAFDPATGRRRWRAALPKWYGEAICATPETVFVAVEYDDRVEVIGVDADTGCRLGSYGIWTNGVTRAAVSEDAVFFGGLGGDGELLAISRP